MNRFSDIDCSLKRLTSVYKFRVAKLFSVEEALQLVKSQTNQLAYYIKMAKKLCRYPSEHGLTRDESASIYIYAMEWSKQSLYRVSNKTLRNKNRHLLKDFLKIRKITAFLIEALNGKKVSDFTEYESEDEIILRMGIEFRVKNNALDHSNRSYIVYSMEIDNDNSRTTLVSSITQMQLRTITTNQRIS
ncbi:unnamed protein product, partial [Adineta steineri]